MRRKRDCPCLNHPDLFCVVCGEIAVEKLRRNLTSRFKLAYEAYFDSKLDDNDKIWKPNSVCSKCYMALLNWYNGINTSLQLYDTPMIWHENTSHETNCYFCISKIKGLTHKTKAGNWNESKQLDHGWVHPNYAYHVEHVKMKTHWNPQHDHRNPPVHSKRKDLSDSEVSDEGAESDEEYQPNPNEFDYNEPIKFNQSSINNLVMDMRLSKTDAQILTSRIKDRNLCEPDVTVKHQRERSIEFEKFFSTVQEVTYCNDIPGLFAQFNYPHVPSEWRLFIDSNMTSLKVALLHNGEEGKKQPSVPIAYATKLKEDYETMEIILKLIKYTTYNWEISADYKVQWILCGMVYQGYPKFMCVHCEWDTRINKSKDKWKKNWKMRGEPVIGENGIIKRPLVPFSKLLPPPLHIKIGAMNSFGNHLVQTKNDENGQKKKKGRIGRDNRKAFDFIKNSFKLTDERAMKCQLTGVEINKLMKSREFEAILDPIEKRAFRAFTKVEENFLGNHRADNYLELIKEMCEAFKAMGCECNLKIHTLHAHPDLFPSNCGAKSD